MSEIHLQREGRVRERVVREIRGGWFQAGGKIPLSPGGSCLIRVSMGVLSRVSCIRTERGGPGWG